MSMFCMVVVSGLGFWMAILSLSLQYKHLLSMLLSLEAVTMNLFIMVFIMFDNASFSGYSALIFIALGACEASLGLSILVALIRAQGNDYVYSLSLQSC